MTPSRLQIGTAAGLATAEWLPVALAVLESGGLVALPTETVYGLVARADDANALERLAAAKGRPPAMAWTWHVAGASALEAFGDVGACVRRLVARYWPGPLTLVLRGVPAGLELCARGGWTGVRCVAAPAAAALCEAASFPLVMSSANRHGAAAAVDFVQLEGLELADEDLLLDGGSTQLREASTILRIGRGRFELLREGLHDLSALRRSAGLRLGFACTGNTCRSPMAAGLARAAIARRLECTPAGIANFGFEIASMGLHAGMGAPAASHAIEVLSARGIDISAHRSAAATLELVNDLDAVYCLTQSHLEALQQRVPPGRGARLHLLDPAGRDIADPIGGDAQMYRACADQIAACIEARLVDWT
jgi:protein-tyrosine phosphatase